VTGGAGYVGAALVPKLLAAGHTVHVLDLFIYGETLDASLPRLQLFRGDLRDPELVRAAVAGCDSVIHLACISNDPSFDLDPGLGRTINHLAFRPLVQAAKDAGVSRFVYASSSSVYGVKDTPDVTEDLAREPLTDYSRYKAICEDELAAARAPGFVTFIVRPATVCGYSPRMRLDLTVNILTNHAVRNGVIKVFGGAQMRPNIHINDMCRFYLKSLEWADDEVDGKVYNVGYENHTVAEIATLVRDVVGESVEIVTTPSDDQRSYHISSDRISRDLGFAPESTIRDAAVDVAAALQDGRLPDSMTDSRYFNIKRMQDLLADGQIVSGG
jgi:nucleoside-diphosphate-sugar epimerase